MRQILMAPDLHDEGHLQPTLPLELAGPDAAISQRIDMGDPVCRRTLFIYIILKHHSLNTNAS